MKRYYTLVQKLASRKTFMLLLLLELIFMFILFPTAIKSIRHGKTTESNKMLDTRFTYTTQTVKTYLTSLNREERKREAIIHFSLDLIYPIIYTLLLSTTELILLNLIINNTGGKITLKLRIWIVSFPLLIMFMDYTENIIVTIMLLKYPVFYPHIAELSGIITTIKWSLVIFTTALIIFLGITYLTRRIIKRNNDSR